MMLSVPRSGSSLSPSTSWVRSSPSLPASLPASLPPSVPLSVPRSGRCAIRSPSPSTSWARSSPSLPTSLPPSLPQCLCLCLAVEGAPYARLLHPRVGRDRRRGDNESRSRSRLQRLPARPRRSAHRAAQTPRRLPQGTCAQCPAGSACLAGWRPLSGWLAAFIWLAGGLFWLSATIEHRSKRPNVRIFDRTSNCENIPVRTTAIYCNSTNGQSTYGPSTLVQTTEFVRWRCCS